MLQITAEQPRRQLFVATPPFDTDQFFASSGLKLTCNALVTAPQRNSTSPSRAFTSMPSEIFKVQNYSLGGHFPKSALALWQVPINNCIFFSQYSFIVLIMDRPNPTGNRHEVLALAYEWFWQMAKCYSFAWFRLVLPSSASCESMPPLELWYQASSRGLLGRPHLVKTSLCSEWSDSIAW